MAVLLTGAGCVEAATTANTVFKDGDGGGAMLLRSKADAEGGQVSL